MQCDESIIFDLAKKVIAVLREHNNPVEATAALSVAESLLFAETQIKSAPRIESPTRA